MSQIRVVDGKLLLGRVTYHHETWVMPLITTGGGVEGLLGPPKIGARAVLACEIAQELKQVELAAPCGCGREA